MTFAKSLLWIGALFTFGCVETAVDPNDTVEVLPLYRSLDDAVAYYRLDEATQVADTLTHDNLIEEFPNALMVTQSTPAVPLEGVPGFRFGQVTEVAIALTGPAAAIRETGELSIEMWILIDSRSSREFFRFGDLAVSLERPGENGSMVFFDPTGEREWQARHVLPGRDMTHVVFTFDDRFMRVYADGALAASRRIDKSWLQSRLANADELILDPAHDLSGHLAEFGIYKRSLRAPEIARHALLGPLGSTQYHTSDSKEFSTVVRTSPVSDAVNGGTVRARITPAEDRPSARWDAGDYQFLLKFPDIAIGQHVRESLTAEFILSNQALNTEDETLKLSTTFWRMVTGWNASTTWFTPWDMGPQEEVDYDEQVATFEPGSSYSYERFNLDITELVLGWLDDPESNQGFLFSSNARDGLFLLGTGTSAAAPAAPTILIHGQSGSESKLSGDKMVTREFTNTLGLSVAISGDLKEFEAYEIYIDGVLTCTTSAPSCLIPLRPEIEDVPDTTLAVATVEVFVVNAFGKVGSALSNDDDQ